MTEKQESIYSRLGRDLTAEKKGVWVDLDYDIAVKVVSPKTPSAQKALKQLQKPFLIKIRKETITGEEAGMIFGSLLAYHVVTDWKGFFDEDGKEINFSQEMAKIIFSNPAMDEVVQLILEVASDSETYKFSEEELEELNEDTEKNLKKTSTGS